MKSLFLVFVVLVFASCAFGDMAYDAEDYYANELRAIWIDANAIPKTDAGVRELVRKYHNANINVLFPETVARGYTVYRSELLKRDPRFIGEIDPLIPMIDEAHKLGMEVHPWVWVFRAGYTKDRGAILTRHPDWAMLSKNGDELSANGGLWISPVSKDARKFLQDLYCELSSTYDVDGIHLDYLRYEVQSPTPYGYEKLARVEFKSLYDVDPITIDRLSQDMYLWNSWRERQINIFLQELSIKLRDIKSDILISAAVGNDPVTSRTNLLQNWVHWAENGWVDFLTPMTYTANNETFRKLLTKQKDACLRSKIMLAPGIGLHLQKNNAAKTVEQINILRNHGFGGLALFATSHLTDEALDVISREAYQTKPKESFRKNIRHRQVPYIPPTTPPLDIPADIMPMPQAIVKRFTDKPQIDGKIDEWAGFERYCIAYDNMGNDASAKTIVMIGYDDSNLYFAFRADEPEIKSIKQEIDKYDGPTFYDDSVEVFVGTDSEYYHFSTNTIGTRFDQKVFSPSWNADWLSASVVNDSGWTTEIAIPLDAVNVKASHGSRCRINLTRNRTVAGKIESFAWSVPYGSFHSPDRFAEIIFE